MSAPTPEEGALPGRVYSDAIDPTFSENLSAAVAADTNGLLTLFAVRSGSIDETYGGNQGNVLILTKEGLAADLARETPVGYSIAPTLVLPNATPVTLDGDFNGDGVVNAADYTVWRDGLGAEFEEADYATWSDNYGAALWSLPASASASAIPEPAALSVLAVAVVCSSLRRREPKRGIYSRSQN